MRRAAVVAAAAVAAALLAGRAEAARFAVGVDPASASRVAAKLRTRGTVSRSLARLDVLVLDARGKHGARGLRRIGGVQWVEWLGSRSRRLSFVPTDPLASKQWYLAQDRAFDFWSSPPVLPPVKVAIVDSGIDLTHPEFAGRILRTKSFVGGTVDDAVGHGTFIAGEIAAATNNGEGIAGIGLDVQLLIAKIVAGDGSVSLEGEAAAIRWAADAGARVINLSLGGLRDPRHPERDAYSPLEAAAVSYAVSKGAVVVAAVGNDTEAPTSPWPYASYPAALPHVIGVSSLARDGSVSSFSDRDAVYNDLAAPGEEMLSTFPRSITHESPSCVDQGYSDCGPTEYRRAQGTSFSAPQVAAAAAQLLAQSPRLTSDQVSTLLERTADDANASNGCPRCPLLRDSLSGWGRLDIANALAVAVKGPLPPADKYEPNDDAGASAKRVPPRGRITATTDYWDDPTDVYSLGVPAGERLSASLSGAVGTTAQLVLWSPQTRTIFGTASRNLALARSVRQGPNQRVVYTVPRGKGGRYYLEVKLAAPGSGRYALSWSQARALRK
jgi:subtilisin family serine protease